MNNLFNKFLIMLVVVSFTIVCQAQTTLSAGDIAIVGHNFTDPDEFAFVCLVDISTNTIIRFTDSGWLSGGGFRNDEGGRQFTAASDYDAFDVIIYSGIGGEWTDYNAAPLNSGVFFLHTQGDQIIAFQGTASSPTPIYAINSDNADGNHIWQTTASDTRTSALPTGLTNGTSAVALDEWNNAYYDDGPKSDINALRTAIGDYLNWSNSNSTPWDFTTIFADPLPVELVSFSAAIKDKSVVLNWKTETEVNNYGFEVQRSIKADKWDVLGFVEGHGNSNSPKEYNFTDSEVNSAGTYSYRLKQIDNDGSYEFSKTIEVDFTSPISLELNQNYPNPFNPTTTISFTLPNSGLVTLKVFSMLGEEVATLANGIREAGIHTFNFNASELPSGVYIYQLSTPEKTQVRKMLLMK